MVFDSTQNICFKCNKIKVFQTSCIIEKCECRDEEKVVKKNEKRKYSWPSRNDGRSRNRFAKS